MIETGEQNIAVTMKKEYKVLIKAPADAEPKTYTITFKASNAQTEITSTTTMKVMPSEDTKVEIAANYVNYSSWFDNVMRAYNSTNLDEENTTVVNDMLSQITGLLIKADSHIKLGEYFEAYDSLSEARTLLMEAENIVGVQESGIEFLNEGRLMVVTVLVVLIALGAGLYFANKSGKINLKMPSLPGKMNKTRSFGGESNTGLKIKQKHAGLKLKVEEFRKGLKKKKETIKKGNFKLPQLRSSE
ncbi:MAG: hypothetical protein KJ906_00905 [Nanoarchaeota archaeon]|nr:hypothetical protein [Nanoarchaeota archaeon]